MFKKTKLCKGLMLAFGGSLALASLPSLAQQAAAPAQLDRVEVTGSAIKRIEGEGATQVQILSRQDIDRLGVQTAEELLRTISAMSSAGQTQLSMGAGLGTYGFSGVFIALMWWRQRTLHWGTKLAYSLLLAIPILGWAFYVIVSHPTDYKPPGEKPHEGIGGYAP